MKTKGKAIISIATAFFVLMLIASTALAVTTYMQAINYQGRLAESGGALVNGPVSMTFAIYNAPSGGAPLWSETQSTVTVTDGAFSVVLGSVNPIDLPFDEQYYLGVQVESDVEMSPRAFLLSVPYAMRAAEVDTIAAGSVTSTEIADGAVTSTKVSAPIYLSSAGLVPTFESKNTGFGKAGQFTVDNASSGAHAISATTNGNGYAVYSSSSGTGYAVYGYTSGTSKAGYFRINNTSNTNNALDALTNGSGTAVYSSTTGTGKAGYFLINNPGNSSDALYATTTGSGKAVYGETTGTGRAGYFKISNASSPGNALEATTTGTGYSGYFSGGAGVYVSGNLNVTGTITGDGAGLTGVPVGAHNHDSEYVNVSGDSMTDMLSVETSTLVSIYGRNYGTGRAGSFVLDNAASDNSAIYTTSNGSGDTVYAEATGTGKAGNFVAGSGTAVSAISDGTAVYARTNGTTGRAGYFWINNSSSTWEAIVATTLGSGNVISAYTNGTGKAGEFKITNVNNTSYALHALTAGKGRAGHFEINNTTSISPALYATTNGIGSAIRGRNSGTSGFAGDFEITGASNAFYALHALTAGTGRAGHFEISNAGSTAEALFALNNGSGSAIKGTTTGSGYSASFYGGAGVYVSGNLYVTGTLTKGSGSFVQPHPTDPSKELVYAFFEGPEHAVFLRGKAKLVDGEAVIETPEYFRAVVGEEGVQVQLTPKSAETFGLAVVEETRERIVVKELANGKGNFEFNYFITAKRAGFEGHEPIQPNTHFTADMKTAEEFEQAYAKDDITSTAMRKLLISNGILTADGKLNMELAKEMGWVVKDSDVAVK